jgi:hypothetical protein
MLDTSTVILLGELADPSVLPEECVFSVSVAALQVRFSGCHHVSVDGPAKANRDRSRADGAALVRDARESSGSRYWNPAGLFGRLVRGLGRLFGELLAEVLLAILALTLFAGVVALTTYGWEQNPQATLGVYVLVLAFLGYGIVEILRAWSASTPRPRRRLAAVAIGTVLLTVLWLLTVL